MVGYWLFLRWFARFVRVFCFWLLVVLCGLLAGIHVFSVLMVGWIGGLQVLAVCMGLCYLRFGVWVLGFLFCDALFVLLLNVYSVIGWLCLYFGLVWFVFVCFGLLFLDFC